MDNVYNLFHLVLLGLISVAGNRAAVINDRIEIVSRDEWGARPPTLVEPMANPVPYVVIHHSYIPEACYTKEECIGAMQWIQDFHQCNHSWNDIGYSFVSGGDNRIYTGRGWSAVGAHAPGYNNKSIGICLIGDWRVELPPKRQLQVVKEFIKKGVKDGYIQENYRMIGHRQVRDTECPGDALYNEIQKWQHYVANPNEDVSNDILLKEELKPDPREDVDFSAEDNKLKRHNTEQFANS